MTNNYDGEYSEDEPVTDNSVGSEGSSVDEPNNPPTENIRKRTKEVAFQDGENDSESDEETNQKVRNVDNEGSTHRESENEGSVSSSTDEETGFGNLDVVNVDKAKEMIVNREKFWAESNEEELHSHRVYDRIIDLVGMLKPQETPRSAMDRFLGRSVAQPKQGFKSTIKAARRKIVEDTKTDSQPQKDISSFNTITELTDFVAGPGGIPGVLDERRESLINRLNRIPFEFRFHTPTGTNEVRGPVNFEALQRIASSAEVEFRRARTSEEWAPMKIVNS